ncbi:MAG: tripartite tricarboxylate transporter TctB family protein [Desulfarculus sp.]|nr:tripartite tricarboxylate transporter TctB family protein [Desulfarculus sp.]
MRTQRTADLWAGLFLAGVGVVVLIAALQIKTAVGERLPPATLPLTLGAFLTLSGLLLSLRSWRSREDGAVIEWPLAGRAWRLAWSFLGLTAYLVLVEPLGMAAASGVFTWGLVWYLDRRWLRALVIAAVTGLVVHFVFVVLLGLTLPQGFWVAE